MTDLNVQVTDGSPLNVVRKYKSTAFFSGYFEKGEINVPLLINSTTQFKQTFGRATKDNYNEWYQVYNYLQYSSNIYVNRVVGLNNHNANRAYLSQSNPLLTIQNKEEFYEQYNDIILDGVTPIRFIARTPGEWGNLLRVAMISHIELANNVIVYDDVPAQKLIRSLRPSEYAVIIIRNNTVVETFIKEELQLEEITEESQYVYVKNVTGYGNSRIDGNIKMYDGNTALWDGNLLYRYKVEPIFYDYNILELQDGDSNLPNNSEILESYMSVESKEDYELDIIIGNEINNNAAIELAATREDCIAYIGTPNLPLHEIITYRNTLRSSHFVMLTCEYKRMYDGFSDKHIWVNVAGDVAGIKAKTDVEQAEWFAAAGISKGTLKNVSELKYNLNKQKQDTLYQNGINSIVQFKSDVYIGGQKTLLNHISGFERINIRSLFNVLERNIAKMTKYGAFEFNTDYNRNKLSNEIKPYLSLVKSARGITKYKIICDETNNTPEIIAANNIVIDIIIQPTEILEFVKLRLYNNGNTIQFKAI